MPRPTDPESPVSLRVSSTNPATGSGITAVITCFNYADHVAGAIESALHQSVAYEAVIVVDDGSSDHSREVIERYSDQVTLVAQANTGHLGACLAGLARVTSPYVHFLDADDRAHPELVSTVMPLLADGPAKVQFQLRVVDEHGIPNGSVYPTFAQGYDNLQMREDNLRLGFYQCTPTSGNVFSTQLLSSLPLDRIDPRGALDGAACLAMPYLGRVVSLNTPLADYGVHGASLSNSHALPSVEQFHKESQEFLRNQRDASTLLGQEILEPNNRRPLYLLEREILTGAISTGYPVRLLPEYLLQLGRSHLTTRQKLLQGLWITSLLVPGHARRIHLIQQRRSGSERPAWLRRLASILLRG